MKRRREKYMNVQNFKNFINIVQKGQMALSSLKKEDKKKLEKTWDIEHAYYSSTLEGSKLDRKEFEKLAANIS
jgi:hypothetical protein